MAETSADSDTVPPAPPKQMDQPASAGGNTDVPDLLERLRTLGQLHDAGYVTDAEFEEIKRRILDGGN